MRSKFRAGALAVFVLAGFGSPAQGAPATRVAYDPNEVRVLIAKMQLWENELGGTDCSGACPGGPNCCNVTAQ